MSASEQIRERLLAGESLTSEVTKEYGVGAANFSHVVNGLKKEGYTFEEGDESPKSYRVASAPPEPESPPSPQRQSPKSQSPKKEPKLPDLGMSLTVTSLNLGPDGQKVVGLQNGSTVFFVEVVARP